MKIVKRILMSLLFPERIGFLLMLTALAFLYSGCSYGQKKSQQKSQELMTTRTLGLAYLEEFKLEEAEKEFLKFIKLAPDQKLGYANLGLTYLRMGKYTDAKKQLYRAIKIDPKDPDIRLILSTVYQMNNERDKAIAELKEALKYSPDHVKTLYDISEIYSTMTDEPSKTQRELYVRKLAQSAPANIVPKLNLTEIYIRKGDIDKAVEQMELIKKLFPEFPKEAADYYTRTLVSLKSNDREKALNSFVIFHNYLRVSSPYQAGIIELKGPGGSLVGFPIITFDQSTISQTSDFASSLNAVRFTDATASSGLDFVKPFGTAGGSGSGSGTFVTAGDYDNDGDIDLYVSSCPPGSSACRHYLFNNNLGRFKDVSAAAGLKHTARESSAVFADFNNDGYLDIYILKEGGSILYQNTGKGTFENVTLKAKVGDKTGGNAVLCFDSDHDGDLDIFEAKTSQNKLYRNNADGTFLEQGKTVGLAGAMVNSRDAVFGDFDDDGDVDLFVVNENGSNCLYSNQRHGIFKDVTGQSGLKTDGGFSAATCGDFDNDGYLDLFVVSLKGGNHRLYRNTRNNSFEIDTRSKDIQTLTKNLIAYDATFIDFNNDGYLDIFITGESTVKGGKCNFLFHNDGKGVFSNASDLLPENIKPGKQIALMDYNDDGDLDLVLGCSDGTVTLLRNDGGNIGHFINMKLVGLRTGSAKNNYYGIGAKVELRAGDLYQTKVVTDPNIHFGIGNRNKADVIRITWTNGVPQNMFFPETNQSFIEQQMLKGSCPFLYAWNGNEYKFVKDILWRSGLGMPLGIMGGTTTYGFADASDDYIKIPGEVLQPKNGIYSLQVTDELWETMYIDKIDLIAVDHPDSIDIFVEEQFTPPPFPGFDVYTIGKTYLPVSATDSYGNDLLPYITEKDDKYLSTFSSGKYQGITEMQELILDPGDCAKGNDLLLFLQGWVFPTDASINFAISQSQDIKVMAPVLQVINEKGEWETVIDNLGFPMGKDKTVIANLSGKFLSKDRRIRIMTNMEIYWDKIFFSKGRTDAPVITNIVEPLSADLHFRGFSRLYRKGGRYGPHWFDYSVVDTIWRWRDLTGNYTRFGDVLPLLEEPDNKYVIINAGDEITIEFNAENLPELKRGWKRDFLIRSVGWVKDGDMNTAEGNTVMPLPYHGMSSYPPGENDIYPDDEELQKYHREYNTRTVTIEDFRNAIKVNKE